MLIYIQFSLGQSTQETSPMVQIKGGTYQPMYGIKEKDKSTQKVKVKDFFLDVFPVTNEQYKQFLEEYPQYQRSQIKRIFAQKSYLSQWKADLDYAPLLSQAPVTNISWFMAKKYCECQGKRLPTTDEWEYVAQADAISALNASDLTNYGAFMRYSLRGTLKANYTSKNLGFRCAKNK